MITPVYEKHDGTEYYTVRGSFDELIAHVSNAYESNEDVRVMADRHGSDFTGVENFAEALELARGGWSEATPEALSIAESAVAKVETERPMASFDPVWDVSGSVVDVGRYLSGEPECMIDFPLREIVKAGRVITLCASVSVSGAVSAESMQRRGAAIVGLAIALSRIGYEIEILADMTATGFDCRGLRIQTLIKSAGEPLDVERVMFALSHPAMLRSLAFAGVYYAIEKDDIRTRGYTTTGLGTPHDPIEDLPDGTIYLPCLLSGDDVPEPERFILDKLRELEILA